MKLIIQIPCLNEEVTLPITLKDLPEKIDGIDYIETLVIDDGSTDKTVEAAQKHNVNHILKFTNNKGLAKAFMSGMNHALKLGADIIVNTDADNQYFGGDIAKLIQPILDKRADIVIGNRQVDTIRHFSPIKIFLQKFGSWIVGQLSGTTIPDATSGFRAYSREAALQHIPVRTNKKLRKSRLFPSIQIYLRRSLVTMLKVYSMYRPLKLFSIAGGTTFLLGFAIGCRYFFFFFQGRTEGHIQSLILSAILLIVGFQIIMMGISAELIAVNRQLLEDIQVRIKKGEMDK